jgi:uncharacterized protein
MSDQCCRPSLDYSLSLMSISVTPALVAEAHAALASGDQSRIAQYFAEDMTWHVRGNNQLAGGKNPSRVLDIVVIYFLRWKDGKIVEGRGAIFGDGTADYDRFWA